MMQPFVFPSMLHPSSSFVSKTSQANEHQNKHLGSGAGGVHQHATPLAQRARKSIAHRRRLGRKPVHPYRAVHFHSGSTGTKLQSHVIRLDFDTEMEVSAQEQIRRAKAIYVEHMRQRHERILHAPYQRQLQQQALLEQRRVSGRQAQPASGYSTPQQQHLEDDQSDVASLAGFQLHGDDSLESIFTPALPAPTPKIVASKMINGKLVHFDKDGNVVKRKRGRPRKYPLVQAGSV